MFGPCGPFVGQNVETAHRRIERHRRLRTVRRQHPHRADGQVEHIVHQTMRRLSAASSTSAAGSALDRSIDEALAAMAAEFGADSVRFGILEPNLGAFCRYAEWPAPEIGIMDDPFVVVPVRLSPQVFKRLARFETVHCATLDELGPEFENDVKFLTTWNLGGFWFR